MNISVVSIHHDCFILEFAKRTVLFDYPAPEHLPPEAAAAARTLLRGKDVLAMISHSHPDHFDPAIGDALAETASARFVVSDDVVDMFPDALPDDPGRLCVMEPDQEARFAGLRIRTLESDDLGVAYMAEGDGLRFHFGGDLALWDWEGLPGAARAVARSRYETALSAIAAFKPDLAFANADPRLASLAGGPLFLATVKPRVFVPMHAFGKPGDILREKARLTIPETETFFYAAPGDHMEFTLMPRP